MNQIDCRGLDCPAPVLASKNAIESENPQELSVLVDNDPAKENVIRFLKSQNFSVTTEIERDHTVIFGKRESNICNNTTFSNIDESGQQKIVVLVTTDRLGNGDDALGKKLMISFIKTLKEMGDDLWRLVFVNNGVKLTIDSSEVLSDLIELDMEGISILVCGTCLSHFELLEKKQIGETTNMLDIVTSMQLSGKVITV